MKKAVSISVLITGLYFLVVTSASAQMMGTGTSMMQGQVSVTPSAQDLQDIQTGKDLYVKFQANKVSCSSLKDDDFEKIGEYIMDQQFGNTNSHIQMNERAKQMMGDQGEERMHISIARSILNCNANAGSQQGGVRPMMYDNFGWGFGIFHLLIAIIIIVDLILAGIWLWKQINKK